ncbi:MAG: hypothetical protein LUG45_06575, partial [Clostridiales bacterium]|nr:hypothetical protein [Clostridiales bacterium]
TPTLPAGAAPAAHLAAAWQARQAAQARETELEQQLARAQEELKRLQAAREERERQEAQARQREQEQERQLAQAQEELERLRAARQEQERQDAQARQQERERQQAQAQEELERLRAARLELERQAAQAREAELELERRQNQARQKPEQEDVAFETLQKDMPAADAKEQRRRKKAKTRKRERRQDAGQTPASEKNEAEPAASQRPRIWTRAAVTAIIIGLLVCSALLIKWGGASIDVLVTALVAMLEAVLLYAFGYCVAAFLASAFPKRRIAFFAAAAAAVALVVAFLYTACYVLGYCLGGYVSVYSTDTPLETLWRVIQYASYVGGYVLEVVTAVLVAAAAYIVGFHAGITLAPSQTGTRFHGAMAAMLLALTMVTSLLSALFAGGIWGSYLLAVTAAAEAALLCAFGYCVTAAAASVSRKKGAAFRLAVTAEGVLVALFLFVMYWVLLSAGLPGLYAAAAVAVAVLSCGVGFRFGLTAAPRQRSLRFCIAAAVMLLVPAAVTGCFLVYWFI